eukprot:TRINITY_DN7303_c0_g2_i3.p1 TRINITY_DN7303_c0_g2~~TRINITY_DN7303_c0_g2_i3.p1  ORF type:complete len:518 (-),score=129.23 TRINITY_DN7303_c0_g2_i3:49-1602(-)
MKCSLNTCDSLVSHPITCALCKQPYCSEICKTIHNRSFCQDTRLQRLRETEASCPFIKLGQYLDDAQADELVPQKAAIHTRYEPVMESRRLGRGSYGEVILVKDKEASRPVAMKIINKTRIGDKRVMETLRNEIEIQRHIVHENIVRMMSYAETEKNIYIIMEYASKGNLFQLVRMKGKFSEREAFFFFTQTCSAIHFLHSCNIIHRDIKPENLLITGNGTLKLGDFGCCSKNNDANRMKFCGTIDYMAPEVVSNKESNEKADVWSLGILLYEMLHGYTPFLGRSESDTVAKILENRPLFRNVYEDAKELIEAITDSTPSKRPEVWEIFHFPWMKRMQGEFGISEFATKEAISTHANKELVKTIGKMPKLVHSAYSAKDVHKVPVAKSLRYNERLGLGRQPAGKSETPSSRRTGSEKNSTTESQFSTAHKKAMQQNRKEEQLIEQYSSLDSNTNMASEYLVDLGDEENKDGVASMVKRLRYIPAVRRKKSLFMLGRVPKCLKSAKTCLLYTSDAADE